MTNSKTNQGDSYTASILSSLATSIYSMNTLTNLFTSIFKSSASADGTNPARTLGEPTTHPSSRLELFELNMNAVFCLNFKGNVDRRALWTDQSNQVVISAGSTFERISRADSAPSFPSGLKDTGCLLTGTGPVRVRGLVGWVLKNGRRRKFPADSVTELHYCCAALPFPDDDARAFKWLSDNGKGDPFVFDVSYARIGNNHDKCGVNLVRDIHTFESFIIFHEDTELRFRSDDRFTRGCLVKSGFRLVDSATTSVSGECAKLHPESERGNKVDWSTVRYFFLTDRFSVPPDQRPTKYHLHDEEQTPAGYWIGGRILRVLSPAERTHAEKQWADLESNDPGEKEKQEMRELQYLLDDGTEESHTWLHLNAGKLV